MSTAPLGMSDNVPQLTTVRYNVIYYYIKCIIVRISYIYTVKKLDYHGSGVLYIHGESMKLERGKYSLSQVGAVPFHNPSLPQVLISSPVIARLCPL